MISGEPPYLLNRINYLTDPAYAGRFDANPLHWRSGPGGRREAAAERAPPSTGGHHSGFWPAITPHAGSIFTVSQNDAPASATPSRTAAVVLRRSNDVGSAPSLAE